MFSYKGIDKNYEYKRGTISASTELEAIDLLKNKESIIVVVSLKKVSNIKSINVIRNGLNNQLESFENSFNKLTGKLAYRGKSKKTSGKKDKETKEEKKSIFTFQKKSDSGEQEELAERSPILRGINNLVSRVQDVSKSAGSKTLRRRSSSSSSQTIVMDDDMHSALENMFKKQAEIDRELGGLESDSYYGQEEYPSYNDDLSSNKLHEVKKNTSKENAGEKKIDWSLLDNEEGEETKKNRKIKVKEKEIIMFTRRLHIMLSSGVALLSALILLQKTSSESMETVIQGVIESIQSGSSFSEAIAKYPRQFNSMYVSLVAVGEKSGGIEQSLQDIIKAKEQQQKVSRKVKIVSIYPIMVGIVLTVMMVAGSIFFLPVIDELYDAEAGVEMPMFTKVVIGIMGKVPMIVAIATISIIIFIIVKRKVPEVNYMYRRYADKFMLKFPVIKDVFNSSYMYSFSSTVGLMLKNGIRLSDTLSLTGRTINNIYIKSQIENMAELMSHGLTFSESMLEQEHFDELLAHIVLTGEESGQMIFALSQISDYYEIELMQRVDALMEIIQPVTIVIVGLIVGVVLAAVYLPILDMSTGMGA